MQQTAGIHLFRVGAWQTSTKPCHPTLTMSSLRHCPNSMLTFCSSFVLMMFPVRPTSNGLEKPPLQPAQHVTRHQKLLHIFSLCAPHTPYTMWFTSAHLATPVTLSPLTSTPQIPSTPCLVISMLQDNSALYLALSMPPCWATMILPKLMHVADHFSSQDATCTPLQEPSGSPALSLPYCMYHVALDCTHGDGGVLTCSAGNPRMYPCCCKRQRPSGANPV